MSVTDDRKNAKVFVYNLLEGVKGNTLGEPDKSYQFVRTQDCEKITRITGDIIETTTKEKI